MSIEGFIIGDCVDVTYFNNIIVYGEITKITNKGFILKLIDGSRIALSYDRIRNIRLIHEKGEDTLDIRDTSFWCENGSRFSFHLISEADDALDYLNGEIRKKGFVTLNEFRRLTETDTYPIKDETCYGWCKDDLYHVTIDRIVVDGKKNRIEYQIVIPKVRDLSEFKTIANDFDGDVFNVIPIDEQKYIKHDCYCCTCKYKEFVGIPGTECGTCVALIGGYPSNYEANVNQTEYQVHIPDSIADSDINPKMPSDRFKELLDELDGNSLNTLKEKNAKYAVDGDCLHNFRSGAEIMGGTPAQACWGYLTKHLVALRDKVMNDDFSDREDFLEKCQDTINYIRFLWCIGNDADGESVGWNNVSDESITELNKRVDDAMNESTSNPKYCRTIRVYSKFNGMLYADFKDTISVDLEKFENCFVVFGLDNNSEVFRTLYQFDNFYCVIFERFGDEFKHTIIDKESN